MQSLWIRRVIHALTVMKRGLVYALTVMKRGLVYALTVRRHTRKPLLVKAWRLPTCIQYPVFLLPVVSLHPFVDNR